MGLFNITQNFLSRNKMVDVMGIRLNFVSHPRVTIAIENGYMVITYLKMLGQGKKKPQLKSITIKSDMAIF